MSLFSIKSTYNLKWIHHHSIQLSTRPRDQMANIVLARTTIWVIAIEPHCRCHSRCLQPLDILPQSNGVARLNKRWCELAWLRSGSTTAMKCFYFRTAKRLMDYISTQRFVSSFKYLYWIPTYVYPQTILIN